MSKSSKGVFWTYYNNRPEAVALLCEKSGLASLLSSKKAKNRPYILIKPNLVNDSPFPVTTPAWIVQELVAFIRTQEPHKEIIVAEGTGQPDKDTMDLFLQFGYDKIPGIDLMDLNTQECAQVDLVMGKKWKSLFLPAILMDSFVISVPVLKAHTLAGVTLSMKNMIGVCPPRYFQSGGFWRKSAFHSKIHEAILDLNMAAAPDFCLLDASVGLSRSHLSGPACTPPVNIIAASADPVGLDSFGASLLSRHWHDIGHIKLANHIIGDATCPRVQVVS